jgi:transposase
MAIRYAVSVIQIRSAASRRVRKRLVSDWVGATKICSGGLNDSAVLEAADLVGHIAGKAHLVRRDQHRHPLLLQLADDLEHLADQLWIERTRDLVQEQRPRTGEQGAGDRHALLLTTRETVLIVIASVAESEPTEHQPARFPGLFFGNSLGADGAEAHGHRIRPTDPRAAPTARTA